jgi:hypothetical protein
MHTSVRRHSSSPLWAPRSTHVGFSLLPPPARRSRVAGRGRGGGVAGPGERATRTTRRLGQGSHRHPRLTVDEAPRGSTPHPARASPESARPATRFASGGREVRAADLQCVNAVALMGRTDSTEGWRAGHRPLGRSRPPRHKPQGQAASDPSGLGPLRLTRPRASSTRRSMPGDPPPRSAFGPVGPPSLLICNSPAHRGEGGVRHPRRFESPEPRKTRPRASGWGRWSRLTAFADRL